MADPALQQGSPQAGIAAWNASDAQARGATLTRVLVRLSRDALQGDDLGELLQRTCDCLVSELPVAIASILLLDEARTRFVQEVYSGVRTHSPLAVHGTWPVADGLAGRCVREGRKQLVHDVAVDPDYIAGNGDVRSEYIVPIRHGGRLHGVLNLESTRNDFFGAEACAVFDAVADLVAGAIHFARIAEELQGANRRLELLTMVDGLTGIANRRRFDQRLREDWERMAGEQRPLALLMVDADAFKPLNDTRGHLYGDECLRTLARICNDAVGEGPGLVARFGGEELALLLPGVSFDDALALAESLRAAVEAEAMPHPASPVARCVTISIGMAVWTPVASRPPELLIADADAALYAAKTQGRNRVVATPAA